MEVLAQIDALRSHTFGSLLLFTPGLAPLAAPGQWQGY